MATVKELLTNVSNNTRKFLGTESQLSLEEMSQGIGEASAESDFQTELIEEFSTILDRSVAPDNYVNGKEDGYKEGVKRLDAFIEGSMTDVSSGAKFVRKGAFYNQGTLTSVDFPNATSVGENAFYQCSGLISAHLPKARWVNRYAFYVCLKLDTVDILCDDSIYAYAFASCYSLKSIILRSETVCDLVNKNAFESCYHILGTKNNTYNPNGDKDGYFYVPRALVDGYKSATNWSTYSTQFRALEDYTVDGTVTGALDPNKI